MERPCNATSCRIWSYGPLQEGRVDGGERDEPVGGERAGEGDRVLLSHADVEEPLGETPGERAQAGVVGHRRAHRHHLRQLGADLDRRVAVDLRVGPARARGALAGLGVEDPHAVEGGLVRLGRPVALAFGRHHVQQGRALEALQVAQGLHQHVEVVAVDRARST